MPNYNNWANQTVYDVDHTKVGTIEALYLDDDTEVPAWATVKSSTLFGSEMHFAPVTRAHEIKDGIQFDVTADQIKQAPSVDVDNELSEEDEGLLFQHYAETSDNETVEPDGDEGHDTSGPDTDEAMTRSEEQLHVSKESQQVGRARLRKYIVTEDVHTTVPLRKEVVKLEHEPITDDNRDEAMNGAELTEEEHEMVISEERAVVSKTTVPVERVKLSKDVVTEDVAVNDTVRKELIDFEDAK